MVSTTSEPRASANRLIQVPAEFRASFEEAYNKRLQMLEPGQDVVALEQEVQAIAREFRARRIAAAAAAAVDPPEEPPTEAPTGGTAGTGEVEPRRRRSSRLDGDPPRESPAPPGGSSGPVVGLTAEPAVEPTPGPEP